MKINEIYEKITNYFDKSKKEQIKKTTKAKKLNTELVKKIERTKAKLKTAQTKKKQKALAQELKVMKELSKKLRNV